MKTRFAHTSLFLMLLACSVNASPPDAVQSTVVEFPANGRVLVKAREEVGKFPQMIFVSERTGEVLHTSTIEDENGWLIPVEEMRTPPYLRFRVVRSPGFSGPLIMSVGVSQGGSDSTFFLTVFGEVGGAIRRLNDAPIFANVQGGYHLGHLNRKHGYGLVVWNFVWGEGADEWHYGKHKYAVEVYKLRGGKLSRRLRRESKRRYGSDDGAMALREFGITAEDQRAGIPKVKDALK